jgi:hypothetical protein
LQFAQANAQTKNCKRASTFATRRKNYFLKSLPSKNFKTADTQARQKKARINDSKSTEIQLLDNDGGQKASLQQAFGSMAGDVVN